MESENESFVSCKPDYKGDGVAVWVNQDRKGRTFLNVKVLGGKAVPCFKVLGVKA